MAIFISATPSRPCASARHVGRLMADDLIAAGITANCLPVLDVPQPGSHDVIGDRAYSLNREQVMALARAHAAGLMDGGVLPVIKHIPGHGRAMADSHLALPVVDAAREDLRQSDFPPFAAFADAPMAMTAHVVYTALDKKFPATLSRKIVKSVIRGEIGFRGLLITDDLSMKALSGDICREMRAGAGGGLRRDPALQRRSGRDGTGGGGGRVCSRARRCAGPRRRSNRHASRKPTTCGWRWLTSTPSYPGESGDKLGCSGRISGPDLVDLWHREWRQLEHPNQR